MESLNPLEVLSRAASCMQDHDAVEISKLPAKKLYTRMTQQQQQNAISNSIPPNLTQQQQVPAPHIPLPLNLNKPHSTTPQAANTSSSNSPHLLRKEHHQQQPQQIPMDMDDEDDEDIEVNVHDDDSPLDMRIATKQQDSDNDSVRPSVIRRAPSFKETSNSPFDSSQSGTADPTSTVDPLLDEHFRRSLGTEYDLIMRNKMSREFEQQQKLMQQRIDQEQIQKQRMEQEFRLQQHLLMQQQQQQQAQQQQQQQQQQNLLKMKHHNYKKHQIHQHQAFLAATASISPKHTQQIATPPSTPSPPVIAAQIPPQIEPQKHVIITESNDGDSNELSVDDHFMKALGDTWKKIQKEQPNK